MEARILALRPPINYRTSDHSIINFPTFHREADIFNSIISMKNENSGKKKIKVSVETKRVHLRLSTHV